MAQSSNGKVRLFTDCYQSDSIANTATLRPFGDFLLGGDGIVEADSGAPSIAGLSGVVRLTTTNEDLHDCLIGTPLAFDVGRMGTITLEARVQFENLDTKAAFIGFSDVAPLALSIEEDVLTGATTTLTLQASDLVGFYLSAELTDDEDWHAVYNGGTTTGETDSTELDLSGSGVTGTVHEAVAGEWQVLRLEISNSGTARWYVNGDLRKTVAGAVSTSVDLALAVSVGTKGNAIETMDVDFVEVTANRDWTV